MKNILLLEIIEEKREYFLIFFVYLYVLLDFDLGIDIVF